MEDFESADDGDRAHWILRAVDWVESLGDWPVVVALAVAVGTVAALAVTGQL